MSQTELEATGGTGGLAATGAPASPAPPKTPAEREYLILESTSPGVWKEKEKVTADSNDAAYDAIDSPNNTASYQAIAMRNWSPKSPKVETVTTVNWQ